MPSPCNFRYQACGHVFGGDRIDNAFRAGFVTLTETYSKVTPSIVLGSFDSALELLEKAEERGKKALAQLDRRARASYWLFPWPRNRSAVGEV
jgi:hypothetical protein